ncbi:Glycosyltransferase involved in cell wall bisynthesis [Eubacterium ruminantium]|nr:Glycosyltransferase involved in cell wall bisynthesis [Eubacterium ruminantium]
MKRKVLLAKNLLTSDGATKVIYDLISDIKKNSDDISFDWYLYSPDGHDNAKRFKELGCRIYLDKKQRELKKRSKLLYFATKYIRIVKFLKKQKYDVIHINTDDMFRFDLLVAAKLAGVPVRIIHSHNSQGENMKGIRGKKALQKAAKWMVDRSATVEMACSESAADWMYSKKGRQNAVILKNGIDIEKYSFDEVSRNEIRKTLGIADDIILLGNIGRFSEQKNHKFLVEVFEELCKRSDKYRLLLIGEGSLFSDIKEQIEKVGLADRVFLPGVIENADKYYSAMDMFVMTSIHEGLPLVGVEAQASGLISIFSDSITRELAITDKAEFISLDEGSTAWAEKIEKSAESADPGRRTGAAEVLREKGYDKAESARILEKIYNR